MKTNMTALRRSVEGWMGDDLYRRIGNEPKIETTWNLLRELVGQQLFGEEFVCVPFIESAVYFNQLFVFTKKKNFWTSLGFKRPTYKIVGNLDYLVDRERSTWVPQFDFSPWDVADGMNMYREYKLRVSSNRAGTEKSVEIIIMESHVRSASHPTVNTLAIHRNLVQDLYDAKTLYVITDVVFASFIKLSIQVGEERRSLVYDRDTPIGFKYKKYKLRPNGTFESEEQTTLRLSEREAQWLRPLEQPVPTVPRFDSLRRRRASQVCGGDRRKIRHNLTIPTPEESDRRSLRRRSIGGIWMQDEGNVVRMNPRRNVGPVVQATDVVEEDVEEGRVPIVQPILSRRALSLELLDAN